MRDIYLDNSATTPVLPEVAAVIREVLLNNYGNPSSLHERGIRAERAITKARRVLAQACGVKEAEMIFTSGGTEANNLAVKGIARRLARRGRHLITTQVEHPSVLYGFRALEAEGFEVTYLPVDEQGFVETKSVLSAMRQDTLLVSIMHVNNEVGTIMPVDEIGRAVKEKNEQTLFHVDAVQSFGKLPVKPREWQADLLTVSAHKIHGPKGCGALYCRDQIPMEPLLHGGDQEKGIRPGTENMAGIAGFAAAVQSARKEEEDRAVYVTELKDMLAEGIIRLIPDCVINSPANGAPHILNVTFNDVKGEVLVHALAQEGIFVSTGSACHSHRADPSHVLLAMKRSPREIEASIRFSFSFLNTKEDLIYTLEKLREAVQSLRLLTRRKR